MAEFDIKEEIEGMVLEHSKVMTGDKNQSRFLYYQLKMSMKKAKRIDIIVSFLMESGVRMLLKDLKSALDRGAQIRILTGNYLGITQPSALYLIRKELGNRIDLRFYNDKARSFHPKSYIFHYENMSEIYIGSSNISKSALTTGIERTFDSFLPTEKASIIEWRYQKMYRSIHYKEIQKELNRLYKIPNQQEEVIRGRYDIASTYGYSDRNAARYLRLKYLIKPLKEMVDTKKIALLAALELSYLSEKQQECVVDMMIKEQRKKLKIKQAQELHRQMELNKC